MSPSRIRATLVTIAVLLLAGIAFGVVVGISDESGNAHRGAPHALPASAAPHVDANAKAPTAGQLRDSPN